MNSSEITELQKAEVLIEALPYIQRFNRKIIVVKYGGSAMVDEHLKHQVIQDVVLLKLVGFKPIIVHGGGKEISRWVNKIGMEPHFVNGLRVTDEPTMEIAEMVLNKVNKSLVQLVNELGVKAVGISGKDGMLLRCEKKLSKGEDIGFVGEITKVDPQIIYERRIFFRSSVRSALMSIMQATTSMRTTQPVPLPVLSMQRSWHSSQMLRGFTVILRIRVP